MKKNIKPNKKVPVTQSVFIEAIVRERKRLTLFPFMNYHAELIFLLLLTVALYINTFWGEYVLDDLMSITGNKFVLQGFAGIKNIFTKDSFSGFVDAGNTLQGGRYRPLALMSFAVEIGLWGKNPHLSHLINIILFVFTSFLVFHLLRNYFFPNQPDVAFISALLFIIHPIHTEVVANIKSRDELFSFMFLLISVILILKFIRDKRQDKKLFVLSLVSWFLALLSKENGVTFVLILPLILFCFSPAESRSIIRIAISFVAVLILFLTIRFARVGLNTQPSSSLLNNPFLNATPSSRFATILFCLLKYLSLLFFPYPQSYDYSFNQIPLTGFDNPLVWLSLILNAAMFFYALKKIKSKQVVAFGILFYMISIFIVSNILIDIGALIGERFLFQPSFGFAIVAGYLVVMLSNKIKNGSFRISVVSIFIIVLLIALGFRTIKRNDDWKSEYTLFLNDVKVSPNSAVANNATGGALVKQSERETDTLTQKKLLEQSIPYFKRASEIFEDFPEAYSNCAIAYVRMNNLEEAEKQIGLFKSVSPQNLKLPQMERYLSQEFYNRGADESSKKNFIKAAWYFEKATQHDSTNAQYWFDLGGTSCMINNYSKGFYALTKCLEIKPDFKAAQMGLEDLKSKGITSGSK